MFDRLLLIAFASDGGVNGGIEDGVPEDVLRVSDPSKNKARKASVISTLKEREDSTFRCPKARREKSSAGSLANLSSNDYGHIHI